MLNTPIIHDSHSHTHSNIGVYICVCVCVCMNVCVLICVWGGGGWQVGVEVLQRVGVWVSLCVYVVGAGTEAGDLASVLGICSLPGALPFRDADAQFLGLAPELRHASLLKETLCDRHISVSWAAGAGRLYIP